MTLALDADTLEAGRAYAQRHQTTPNALVRAMLSARRAVCPPRRFSTQVMQEFFVAATRKLGVPPLAAKGVLKTFSVFEIVQVSAPLIHEAIDCSILNQLSFWHSLVLAAAASAGCATVYSEDLNPGQTIPGVAVRNPLA